MGPSGSGKSTLLHLLAGLEMPSGGSIRIGGRILDDLGDDDLSALRRRKIGLVFQKFNLLEVLFAEENVALPLILDGKTERDAYDRAREVLDFVDMGNRCGHAPGELSGGEQQRVAIARALVNEPMLVLADEPTGNLDVSTSDKMVALLRSLDKKYRQTVLIVTHDARVAAAADRIIRLRDGLIVDEQRLSPSSGLEEVLKTEIDIGSRKVGAEGDSQ